MSDSPGQSDGRRIDKIESKIETIDEKIGEVKSAVALLTKTVSNGLSHTQADHSRQIENLTTEYKTLASNQVRVEAELRFLEKSVKKDFETVSHDVKVTIEAMRAELRQDIRAIIGDHEKKEYAANETLLVDSKVSAFRWYLLGTVLILLATSILPPLIQHLFR